MTVLLWVLQIVLALVYLGAGVMKLARSKADLRKSPQMAWTDDFSAGAIKGIGVAEVLAAIGLILPAAFDVAPVLTPLAAVGLVLLMILALFTHIRRSDPTTAKVVPVVLGLLAAFVAGGRF